MGQVTITLSEERARRLAQAAKVEGKTIDALVEESLAASERAARQRFLEILQTAQANAAAVTGSMTDDEVMELAVEATREVRREMAKERGAAKGNPRQ